MTFIKSRLGSNEDDLRLSFATNSKIIMHNYMFCFNPEGEKREDIAAKLKQLSALTGVSIDNKIFISKANIRKAWFRAETTNSSGLQMLIKFVQIVVNKKLTSKEKRAQIRELFKLDKSAPLRCDAIAPLRCGITAPCECGITAPLRCDKSAHRECNDTTNSFSSKSKKAELTMILRFDTAAPYEEICGVIPFALKFCEARDIYRV